ncbi:MAG: TatD family hydrolase [Candidatus Aenigmarchaeota archaeon]|nr:TatD family hydrolase [Candidatus Aenigmarchaeota archaeon]
MIDSHCHIDLLDNAQEVIDEARKKGMAGIIISAADPNELGNAMSLANANKDFVYVCAGFHPHHVNDYDEEEVEEYIEQINGVKYEIAAIGEIGLDYSGVNDEETKQRQKAIFAKFLKFAIEIQKPVVVHIRDAFDDALEILSNYKPRHVMLHCFSGSEMQLKISLERGYFISFATNVCYTKKHPRLAVQTPLKNMLLETDSPWLEPNEKLRKNSDGDNIKTLTNRPWNIEQSAEIIAGLKKMLAKDVIGATTDNAKRCFGI